MTEPPVWTEEEHQREIALVRKDCSERCALLNEQLARIFEVRAAKLRAEGSYTTRALWPFGKIVTVVMPRFERAAQTREDTARSLRIIAGGCRAGWDPRALERESPSELVAHDTLHAARGHDGTD